MAYTEKVTGSALDPSLSTKARGRVVRAIAAQTHAGPFGGQHRYSRDSLDRWIRRYRVGGFDALMPSIRQPGSRIDTGVLELAVALKRENPQRTAAQVARILRASTGYSPSESTLLRLFHRRELMGPAAGGGVVFGRFEADAPNQRWVGDALHGPKVGGRKTYLFAFLDDHSRLAVGYRFGYAEDTVRLAAVLEPALACRGVPASCYVDNGSAFVDAWLLRACGKLGIRLVHSTPHRPQGRGKIERFFRTVRDQFLVEVADTSAAELAESGQSPAAALLELNGLFTAWVESVYHHQVHSETGQSPLARWNDGWQAAGHGPVMPAAAALTGQCVGPYPDHADVNGGGPARGSQRHRRHRRWQDGWLRRPSGARPQGLHRCQQSRLHELQDPGCHGLSHPVRHPQLLGLCPQLRAPRPHVRTQRLLEPALASVSGLGVVGALHPTRQPGQLHQRLAKPGQPPRLRPRVPPSRAPTSP